MEFFGSPGDVLKLREMCIRDRSMGHKVTEEDYAKISIYEHKKILDAMKAHDGSRARKLMNDHIIRSMKNILTRFETD